MNGKLAQNVRAKFFQDFEKAEVSSEEDQPQGTYSPDVQAMLCGFILEGDDLDYSPEAASVEQDWFYKL